MKITKSKSDKIKNILAVHFCGIPARFTHQDKGAWRGADIEQRETLGQAVKQINAVYESEIQITGTSKIVLPLMVVKDLKKVIQYLYDDELKHFEEVGGSTHIWHSVCRLENFLNSEVKNADI